MDFVVTIPSLREEKLPEEGGPRHSERLFATTRAHDSVSSPLGGLGIMALREVLDGEARLGAELAERAAKLLAQFYPAGTGWKGELPADVRHLDGAQPAAVARDGTRPVGRLRRSCAGDDGASDKAL
ncbi:MAG: hypothetical protein M5U28_23285 [Sandaracinaceae bacterium]|nr:hypothetical protein [Sandaracinaceae bacterium]